MIVDAWAEQGESGLRDLKKVATREERVARLMKAVRAEGLRQTDGSFFGGLLDSRFGADGLVDHLIPLLESLRKRPIEGGAASLFDALLYIANCHATGVPGINARVLAALCGIPPFRTSSAIVEPLGREVGAAESHGHVLTRHKRVAEAIVVAAHRLGADLAQVWERLVKTTVAEAKEERIGDTYSMIVLAGSHLMKDLPKALGEDLRGEIAISAGKAAVKAVPEWTGAVSALARAYRSAGYAQDAFKLFKERLPGVSKTVDQERVMRGYFNEWSACAGQLTGRDWSIKDVWLAAISLSDVLPGPVTTKDVKLSCSGLASAFERLSMGAPAGVYAKGRRAATHIGWQGALDHRARRTFSDHQKRLDQAGTPKPADNEKAMAWLADGASAAWRELGDPDLRRLAKNENGRLSFNMLKLLLVQK
jgi:hypothetical protein